MFSIPLPGVELLKWVTFRTHFIQLKMWRQISIYWNNIKVRSSKQNILCISETVRKRLISYGLDFMMTQKGKKQKENPLWKKQSETEELHLTFKEK